jgi:hypothetical protein
MAKGKSFYWDDKDFRKLLDDLGDAVLSIQESISMKMADTIRAISQNEVPLDVATLERSVNTEFDKSEGQAVLSYNTEYAAYQHEGVSADGTRLVQNWQHGRKKKYVEDPIKMNLTKLNDVAKTEFENRLSVLK